MIKFYKILSSWSNTSNLTIVDKSALYESNPTAEF
jgi:hypothetical protein